MLRLLHHQTTQSGLPHQAHYLAALLHRRLNTKEDISVKHGSCDILLLHLICLPLHHMAMASPDQDVMRAGAR